MEQKAKLETVKGGPYKWTAGKEGDREFQLILLQNFKENLLDICRGH